MYAMAAPHPSDGVLFAGSGETDGIPEWLHLIRGVFTILQSMGHWIVMRPLRPLIDRSQVMPHELSNSDELHLAALQSLFSTSSSESPERQEEVSTYRDALETLRESFSRPVSTTFPQRSHPYLWPFGFHRNILDFRASADRKHLYYWRINAY